MFRWLRDKENRSALLAIVTIVTTLSGGGWFLYETFVRDTNGNKSDQAVPENIVQPTIMISGDAGNSKIVMLRQTDGSVVIEFIKTDQKKQTSISKPVSINEKPRTDSPPRAFLVLFESQTKPEAQRRQILRSEFQVQSGSA